MHLKRQRAPSKWPVQRKGTTFIVSPSSNLKLGIPILVVLRDILKVAQNKKEVKRAFFLGNILVNQKKISDFKYSLFLYDKITIIPSKKYYRLGLSESGKFALEDISEKDSYFKIAKIIDKKTLKGKKTQLNLSDGRNFISDLKCNVNDSVKIDFAKKQVTECLPLKEKAHVIVFAGKHSGKKGTIGKIDNEKKIVEVESGKGDKVNVLIKQLMVTL